MVCCWTDPGFKARLLQVRGQAWLCKPPPPTLSPNPGAITTAHSYQHTFSRPGSLRM